MKSVFVKSVVVFALLMLAGMVFGDEVMDSMEKAKVLYKSGKLSEAVNELNYSINLIQQIQLDRYKTAFPAALPGWDANEFNSDNVAMSFMGGGLSINRTYEKQTTEGQEDYNYESNSVEISMVSDSPLLSSLLMMFNNPMFLGGNKMVSIQGEKAVESKNDNGTPNELQIVIENRVVISISAYNCSKEDLYAYANKIDFAKVKSFLKN